MVKNNIFLAFRQLKKNKLFSLINILGLSLSMVATLLIFKYVSFEKSYDDFHRDADNVYRIFRQSVSEAEPDDGLAQVFAGISPLAKAEIPEFVSASRFISWDKIFNSFALSYFPKQGESHTYNIEKAFYADTDAFDILGFRWSAESTAPSLDRPGDIVISRSVARKFFGDQNPVGQILRFKNHGMDMQVTGVFEDLPDNTHFKIDVLCSMKSLPARWNLDQSFDWGNFYLYARLSDDADVAEVKDKLNRLLKDRGTWFAEAFVEFRFMSIKDIHLKSHQDFELEANGSENTVTFLTIVGIFIMLIAWVNYINLTTTKLIDRAKEVGMRKVLGGHRSQLMYQFMAESLLLNGIAMVLTFTLLQASIGFFEGLLGIPLRFFSGPDLLVTLLFCLIFISGAVVFSLYPAFLFSNMKAMNAIKGRSKRSKSGMLLRKVLIVVQFAIALLLITGTTTIFNQLQFMQNQSIGMDIDQTLIVKKPYSTEEERAGSQAAFMNGVRGLSGVEMVSATSEIPGQEISYMRWIALGTLEESKSLSAKLISVDEYFTDLYDIKALHGRSFQPEFVDTAAVVLNLSAAKALFGKDADLDSWINQTIYYELAPVTLVGIINDISQESLKVNTEPHIYMKHNRVRYYSIKLSTSDYQEKINQVKAVFDDSYASSHFDYFFLDEYFNRQYNRDRLFGKIFSFFSILAIVVTILGLFGLSHYSISQKQKEVSIRKVLGASFKSLSLLLTREYLRLILVSTVISIPLAYYLAADWLENFANRIQLNLTLFTIPIILVLGITLLTVAYQVIKTALSNPADTLRWE